MCTYVVLECTLSPPLQNLGVDYKEDEVFPGSNLVPLSIKKYKLLSNLYNAYYLYHQHTEHHILNCSGTLSIPYGHFQHACISRFLKRQWRIRFRRCCLNNCCCCFKGRKIAPNRDEENIQAKKILNMSYLERERSKPDLGDFTLAEYTEKVIVYGYLMVSLHQLNVHILGYMMATLHSKG